MLLVTATMRVCALHANGGREDLGGTPLEFLLFIYYIYFDFSKGYWGKFSITLEIKIK